MKKAKFILISLVLALVMLSAQVLTVFAGPLATASIGGQVTYVEVIPDESTGLTAVFVTLDNKQKVRISVETAEALHLIYNDGEGYVVVEPFPSFIEIDAEDVISDEPQHPVASALVTFFSDDIDGLTYDVIMEAHEQNGFGVIAQALWMTRKLIEENGELFLGDEPFSESAVFLTILDVRNGGSYSVFFPDDETAPTNWGQFKKAILSGEKKANLGAVMLHMNENAVNNASIDHANNNQNKKDKPDRPNRPNHGNNGNNGNNGNDGNNGNGQGPG